MRIVVKLGGHAFPLKLDVEKISDYANVFKKVRRRVQGLIVVVGGGGLARLYIKVARELGANETLCDLMGIKSTQLNARLLIAGLQEDVYPIVPNNVQEVDTAFESGKIVVLGGLRPGQSTNAVVAVSAESINADLLINATDVDGVYTADPEKDPNAKKLDEIGAEEFLKKVLSKELWAGSYELFDPVAIKIVKRSRIPTRIISGRKVGNIERVIKGEKLGTLILV